MANGSERTNGDGGCGAIHLPSAQHYPIISNPLPARSGECLLLPLWEPARTNVSSVVADKNVQLMCKRLFHAAC